jgi:hypothetical protein
MLSYDCNSTETSSYHRQSNCIAAFEYTALHAVIFRLLILAILLPFAQKINWKFNF